MILTDIQSFTHAAILASASRVEAEVDFRVLWKKIRALELQPSYLFSELPTFVFFLHASKSPCGYMCKFVLCIQMPFDGS